PRERTRSRPSARAPRPRGRGACGRPPGPPPPKPGPSADTPPPRAAGPPRPPARDAGRRTAATSPREVALEVLRAVADRDAYANLLLPALLADHGLRGRDAALATELAYGTLRGRGTYDAVLAACSTRALANIDPPLLDVLRLGAHQLLATRIGPHAAVA